MADRGRLYDQVDRIHQLADDLERRLDGDRAAFDDRHTLELIDLAMRVRHSLNAIDTLVRAGSVVHLDDRRKDTR